MAALYVDRNGPYPSLVREFYDEPISNQRDFDWFDRRDAKAYAGPWPVVAHPPCGPWGRLRFLCRYQDASCGPHGVAMVRKWGGVLEHPSESTLFAACAMPRPNEPADPFGGRTYAVRQVAWGRVAMPPVRMPACTTSAVTPTT